MLGANLPVTQSVHTGYQVTILKYTSVRIAPECAHISTFRRPKENATTSRKIIDDVIQRERFAKWSRVSYPSAMDTSYGHQGVTQENDLGPIS